MIDVGITRTEDGLVGDVAPEVAERAGLLTPVPGRRRADDDCDAAAQHGARCALPDEVLLHIRAM